MELETIAKIAEVAKSGGPVLLIVAIWVAYKAGGTAQRATKALEDIRDMAMAGKASGQQVVDSVQRIERTTGDTHQRVESGHMKLDAILARTKAG